MAAVASATSFIGVYFNSITTQVVSFSNNQNIKALLVIWASRHDAPKMRQTDSKLLPQKTVNLTHDFILLERSHSTRIRTSFIGSLPLSMQIET